MAERISSNCVEDLLLLLLHLDCHIESPASPSVQLSQKDRLYLVHSAILRQQSAASMRNWGQGWGGVGRGEGGGG